MTRMRSEILLREYVRKILKEEAYSGESSGYGSPMGYEGPAGMGSPYQGDLFAIFGKPFLDVVDTAIGKTKEVTTKARTMVKVAFGTIVTTLIPGLKANYNEVFDEEEQRIQKIRSDYADVFKSNDDAFGKDAVALAFMASPALCMGAMGAKMAPKAAKTLASAATGGLSDDIGKKLIGAERWMLGGKMGEGLIREKNEEKEKASGEGEKKENKKKKLDVKDILTNPKFLKKAFDNSKTDQMRKAAQEIYKETLSQIYDQAEMALKKAKTPEDLEKMSKKKIPELDEIKKLPPQEKKAALDKIFKITRESMKQFYVKSLQDHIKEVISAGIPEEADYVKSYKETMQKIKAL